MGWFGGFCFLSGGILEREPLAMTNSVSGLCLTAISLFPVPI
jgi:hypothetical protein